MERYLKGHLLNKCLLQSTCAWACTKQ